MFSWIKNKYDVWCNHRAIKKWADENIERYGSVLGNTEISIEVGVINIYGFANICNSNDIQIYTNYSK
jgi:hypothetical protein